MNEKINRSTQKEGGRASHHLHPKILKDPPPGALFLEYGDSTINFELRAWTDQFDSWPQTRSDLAVALYGAIHAAGMSFPFPQREVRLLRDSDDEPKLRSNSPPTLAGGRPGVGIDRSSALMEQKKEPEEKT